MEFNPALPNIMHVDLNSCFASIEQQANPLYRGRPLVVAAYTTGNGCILASSCEAKALGIKTGMAVAEGKHIYPRLIVLPPDPPKYREVNKKLYALLSSYTPDISIESIDEMVLKMLNDKCQMLNIAKEIKKRIKEEIGEWLTVSIGISTNRYLAKVASNLHKPDGLDVITGENIEQIFLKLKLEDLTGIKERSANRLRFIGIMTAKDLLHAPAQVISQKWWSRLQGYDDQWDEKSDQKSFGQSFAMGHPHTPQEKETYQILTQLVVKMGRRLRADGFAARGIGVSLYYRDHTSWGNRKLLANSIFSDNDYYFFAKKILEKAPSKLIRILAVWTYHLVKNQQESLLEMDQKKQRLTQALDAIADRWGEFTVTPARMINMEQRVLDRIAFGR